MPIGSRGLWVCKLRFSYTVDKLMSHEQVICRVTEQSKQDHDVPEREGSMNLDEVVVPAIDHGIDTAQSESRPNSER